MQLLYIILFVFCISQATSTSGSTADAEDQKFMDTAWRAVHHVNQETNSSKNYLIPIEVKSAETSGNVTTLQVYYGASNCSKKSLQPAEVTSSTCQVASGAGGGSKVLFEITTAEQSGDQYEDIDARKIGEKF